MCCDFKYMYMLSRKEVASIATKSIYSVECGHLWRSEVVEGQSVPTKVLTIWRLLDSPVTS